MPIHKLDDKVLDELIKNCKTQEDFFGENGLIKSLVKSLLERAMNAELTHHLGYDKYDPKGKNSGNSRNGTSLKNMQGDNGDLPIGVPRDRNGTYTPEIIPKHQTRFEGLDDKILALYANSRYPRAIA